MGRERGPRFDTSHGGGQSGVCASGFMFTETGTGNQVCGPLTAILAVAGPGIASDPQPDDPDMARPTLRR